MIDVARHVGTWRWDWVNEGTKDKPKWKAKAIRDCQHCTEQEFLGCGYDPRYAGKAQNCPSDPDSTLARLRTCPEFYFRQRWTQSLLELLPHYIAGALGNMLEFPAATAIYLEHYKQAQEEFVHRDNG